MINNTPNIIPTDELAIAIAKELEREDPDEELAIATLRDHSKSMQETED